MHVLLLDDDKEQTGRIRRALTQAGHEVADFLPGSMSELQHRVTRLSPGLLMINVHVARTTLMEELCALLEVAPLPIVMFVKQSDPEMTRNAIMTGVSAYIIDGLDTERLQPVMELAMARFNKCQALNIELKKVRGQLAERKLIERAKGIVMQQSGLTEAQAFTAIRKRAMDQNLRLAAVADAIITAADLLGGQHSS